MDEVKIGARNSRNDAQRLQQIHDFAVENGAMCDTKSIDPDELVYFGGEVKAIGGGKVGGYLVRYSTKSDPDLTEDFFDPETNINVPDSLPVLYQHGMDAMIGKSVIGTARTKKDDVGLWVEAQLNLRNEYEQAIYALAEAGKLGWSSGALSHLVEREPVGKSYRIKSWFIGEASLTPTPAEPRNSVVSVKSLLPSEAAATDKGEQEIKQENQNMEANEIKAVLEENNKSLVATIEEKAEAAATKAVENVLDKLPEVKARLNGNVQVTENPEDRPFKSVAEQMFAMKQLATTGRVDPRMKRIQAISAQWMNGNEEGVKAILGSNETIPSQGEFLLEPTISAEFLKPIHEEGPLTRLAKRMPVGPNSISGWINGIDETARTVGNRWGGVRGYWLSEGDSMTASQPKFKRINWELHQLAVLQYATDNMLRDAALMNSVINQSSMEELKFLVNDAFFRGSGAGQPKGFGVAANAALISATRTNATNIDHDDILRMKMRLPAGALSRAVWLANPDIMGELDSLTFTSGSTGILSPYVRYDQNGVMNLAGRPVIFNEFCPTLGSVGDLLLWDPNDYLYWEGAGIEGASSIHVQFLTNQTVFRFIYRVDGMPASYSAVTPYQGSTTVSPYVALAATT